MSPRTGRPTDDPKRTTTTLRLSDEDNKKLSYCCEQTGKSKSEIIRAGIDRIYGELTDAGNKRT